MAKEYFDILLTDLKLHASAPRKPQSLGRKIAKAVRNKKPGRAYSKDIQWNKSSKTMKFSMDIGMFPEIQKAKEYAEKQGKELRILVPKDGLPVYLGDDAIEKIAAERKK